VLGKWLAFVAFGLAVFIGASLAVSAWTSHPAVQPVTQPGALVVVSMPTLSWTDVSATRTPTLWALAKRGAVAAQPTRGTDKSCSDESWLTFSAGTPVNLGRSGGSNRTGQLLGGCAKSPVPKAAPDGSAVFPHWDSWRHQNHKGGKSSDLGRLGSVLATGGQCIAAAGDYAALGAANRQGVIAHYTPNANNVDLKVCPITFIGLKGPDDRYVARLVRRLPADATIVVSGMADDSRAKTLHTLIITGPGVPHGLLTSLSTRQPGFLQTTDLSALALTRVGSPPTLREGRRPVVRPSSDPTAPITKVTGLTQALNIEHPFVPVFFGLFLGGAGLAMAIGLAWVWMARRRPDGLPPVLRWWFAVVGAMCASMPVTTFLVGLVPWWRSPSSRVALSIAIIAVSAALTAVALLGPWKRWVAGPMTFLMAATISVIALDVVHGSRLQFISMMGLQPVHGGRYFGQGNVAFAVFSTTALLLAAVLAGRMIDTGHRRLAASTVVLIGLAAVIVDGSPSWGADGGGPLAMIPAFAYLTLNAAGLALTWRRLAVIIGSTVTIVGSFAVLDYLRPPQYRTHLGEFVAQLVDTGQLNGLADIWTGNWAMLTSTGLNMTVAVLMFATVLVLLMPHLLGRPLEPLLARVTLLGHGLAAVAVCWMIGFFSNDSGTAIPPTGLLVVIPLLVLLAACLRQHPPVRIGIQERTDQESRSAAVGVGPSL